MARLLLLAAAGHTASTPGAATLALLVVAVLVVAAVLVSLCTSSAHAKMWGQQRGSSSAPVVKPDGDGSVGRTKQLLSATLSEIGGKAARMVSWNRRAPSPGGGCSSEGEEAVGVLGMEMEEEEAVWRKAIIMGDKCRPLQFSGHIAFDSHGNQLPAAAVKKIAAGPDDVQVKN